ncbi:hypothetical protein Taro_049300, partial [Colocasia esculenta]|nr:hypothetical protein [Colocasia esculenta]
MANKLISQMGLPPAIANIFAARNISTAKDALSMTELDLMALLDVDLGQVKSAVSRISEIVCPPYQTALSLTEDRIRSERSGGHLPTLLKGLDDALCGGIPFGSLTEVVGPAGIGKTQFCLKLALLAALPVSYGGLDGRIVYVDTESKFSSQRLMEIGRSSFPQIFQSDRVLKEMGGRIVVLRPSSLSEFTERSVAELSRTPVIVTNQVRGQTNSEALHYPFEGQRSGAVKSPESFESHLVAALGIQWAHAVTVRLVFEAHS